MLAAFREHATSWLIKIALLLIVVVFVFWGGYSYTQRRASRLARVGDVFISLQDYNHAYDSLVDNYRRQLGDAFSQDLIQRLNLKEQALQLLINRLILAQAAHDLGLSATTEEVQRQILALPAFQNNGRFDRQRYLALLQRNRMTPGAFEQQLASDMTRRKVQDFIQRQAVVTEEEVDAELAFDYSPIELGYAVIDPKPLEAGVEVDDAKLQAYYEAHKDSYQDSERRRFRVVAFKPESYADRIQVTERDLEDYYNNHPENYHREKQVRARHILFRLAQDAPPEEVERVRAKAEEVLKQAREGSDFAALATQYSQDSTAAQGGDLGYLSRKELVPSFADAVFAVEPGSIGELVRTRFGFHIIKVEDVRPAETTPLAKVRDQIEAAVKKEKGRDLAFRDAQDFADLAYAERDLPKAAAERQLTVNEPEQWLAPSDPFPEVGPLPKAMKELFSIEADGVSQVQDFGDGFAVFQVRAIRPPQPLPLAQVKDRVEQDLRAESAHKTAETKAAELLKLAGDKGDLQAAAKQMEIPFEKTTPFSRSKPFDELKLSGEALDKVFLLDHAHPFPEAPLELEGRYLVVQLTGKSQPTAETMTAERPRVRELLLKQKEAMLWQAWLEAQLRSADVELLQKL